MKIEIDEIIKTPKIVDIKLPVYRKHDLEDSVIYTRIEKGEGTSWSDGKPHDKLRCIDIKIQHEGVSYGGYSLNHTIEIEITENYFFDRRSGNDYNLGQGEHALTKEEFDRALAEAIEFVTKIKP